MAIRKINSRAIEDGAVTADDLGSFTSVGIDDNATSTAITIDSSGTAIVGSTSSDPVNDGIRLKPAGQVTSTINGDVALLLNRRVSDGTIAQFRIDNGVVGSIGSAGGGTELYIGSSGTNKNGIYFTNSNWLAPMQNLAVSDNTQNIGHPSYRWKDLYLSGGVYVGGTGSANYLDDYEEGTWTAVDVNDTAYNAYITCTYTKIGRIVYFNFDIASTGSTTGTKLGGLPFTAASSSVSNNWSVYTGYSTSNADICGHINAGTDEVNITVGSTAHTLNGRWIGAGFYYV